MTDAVRTATDALAGAIAGSVRCKPGSIELVGREFEYGDLHSAYYQLRQIFLERLYAARLATDNPRILDLGGHVGAASLYYSLAFPEAVITSLECDEALCQHLKANMGRFGCGGVDVKHAAAWSHNEGVRFAGRGDDSGCVCSGKGARVPSVRVADLIGEEHVDLLKIDIEGAELTVLPDCAHVLHNVSRIICEVHSLAEKPARLGDLFSVLDNTGFRYAVFDHHQATWLPESVRAPFPALPSSKYIFTLYAWREQGES